MAEYYYLAPKIVTLENTIRLGAIDTDIDIDPVALLSGAPLAKVPTYINITLAKTAVMFTLTLLTR